MITGELKNKIDSLWEIFWTGGLTNPLDVIEQMTYLMFIHDLDETDNTRAKESAMLGLPHNSIFAGEVQIGDRVVEGSQLKWSVFRDYPAERMYAVVQEMVFPFIKNLHNSKESAYSKYMDDAIFKLPTPLMLSKVGCHGRALCTDGKIEGDRCQRRCVRVPFVQTGYSRSKRPVPYPAAYYKNDGGDDGSQGR